MNIVELPFNYGDSRIGFIVFSFDTEKIVDSYHNGMDTVVPSTTLMRFNVLRVDREYNVTTRTPILQDFNLKTTNLPYTKSRVTASGNSTTHMFYIDVNIGCTNDILVVIPIKFHIEIDCISTDRNINIYMNASIDAARIKLH